MQGIRNRSFWGKLFYGVFCKKCFFRKEKAILQKDHGGSVGLINSGNISYRIAGSDQMFSTAVILPGNIASYGGKCSRGKAHCFHIYGGPDTVLFFPQRDISGGNVPENRKYHSGYLPEKYRMILLHSLSFHDYGSKIHVGIKKLRLPEFQTEICNFTVIGRRKSQLSVPAGWLIS